MNILSGRVSSFVLFEMWQKSSTAEFEGMVYSIILGPLQKSFPASSRYRLPLEMHSAQEDLKPGLRGENAQAMEKAKPNYT